MDTNESRAMLTYFRTNKDTKCLINRLLIEELTPFMLSDWMATYIGTKIKNGSSEFDDTFQFGLVDYLQIAEVLVALQEAKKKEE